jgi:hypothetical protein
MADEKESTVADEPLEAQPPPVPRPIGTRVQLKAAANTFVLRIPPPRPSHRYLAPAAFGVFLMAWGVLSWFLGQIAPLNLTVMELIGGALLVRFGGPLVQTTNLYLDREKGWVRTTPLGRTHSLGTPGLTVRIGAHIRFHLFGEVGYRSAGTALLLENGPEPIALLAGFSRREMDWVASELRCWLGRPGPAG